MRHNKILAASIASLLALPLAGQAQIGLRNVNSEDGSDGVTFATGWGVTAVLDAEDSSGPSGPGYDLDPDNQTVVKVPYDGIVYARELFGVETPIIPSGNKAAVVYQIDGSIGQKFEITFTLSDGKFSGDPELAISAAGYNGDVEDDINTNKTGGSGSNSVKFEVNESTTTNLHSGDLILLVYQLQDTSILAESGGKVEMSVKLTDEFDGPPIALGDTVTVAQSKRAITAEELRSNDGEAGKVTIAVDDASKSFTGEGDAHTGSSDAARIGYLNIENEVDVYQSDGINQFILGDGGDANTESSTLTITSGQFAASMATPGKVILYQGGSEVATAEVSDEENATFTWDNTTIDDILGESEIRIVVDGSTEINTTENPPEANLTIHFEPEDGTAGANTPEMNDIVVGPVELRQIKKDGLVCMVYNVPATGASDNFNLRITNNSSVSGTVEFKMYDSNGVEIASSAAPVKLEIEAGKTLYRNAAGLIEDGFSWSGRAIMEIISTLPNLEVLAMLRSITPGSPLTNVSVGATGSSCSQ